LTGLAGALGARRYGQLSAGTLVGASSGLVSGLIGLATMQVLALTAMPILRRDPQNLAEFRTHSRGAGDLSTAIAGDFLAAGINHLVLVGLVAGSVLATIGGAIGLAVRAGSGEASCVEPAGPGRLADPPLPALGSTRYDSA
jgi:hypothetical protein